MNLSLSLAGIPSSTFYDMKNKDFEGYKQYSVIIKTAKEQIAMIEAAMVRDGKIPPALWIFRSKNYLRNERCSTNRSSCTKSRRCSKQ